MGELLRPALTKKSPLLVLVCASLPRAVLWYGVKEREDRSEKEKERGSRVGV